MLPRRIKLEPSFRKALENLPPNLKEACKQAVKNYRDRTNQVAVSAERIRGAPNYWSIRINDGYRAFFKEEKDEQGKIFSFIHVGPHNDYRIFSKKRGKR